MYLAFDIVGDRYLKARRILQRFDRSDLTADLCQNGNALRTAGLKQLLYTGKTLCDVSAVSAGNTAGGEGPG